jgi:hypothetical protein
MFLKLFFKRKSAGQSPSAEADCHAATQQNLRILWKLKVYYRVHNSQLLGHILSNLVQGIKYPDAQNQEFLGALVAP